MTDFNGEFLSGLTFEQKTVLGLISESGGSLILDNATILNNLNVQGSQTILNVDTLSTEDPLVVVGSNAVNNTSNGGIVQEYFDTTTKFSGMVRDSIANKIVFTKDGATADDTTTVIDIKCGLVNGIDVTSLSAGVTDHTLLTNIGTNTHSQIDTHISSVANPHVVTKTQVGLSDVPNTDFTTAVGDNTTHRGLTNNPHAVSLADVSPVAGIDEKQLSILSAVPASPFVSDLPDQAVNIGRFVFLISNGGLQSFSYANPIAPVKLDQISLNTGGKFARNIKVLGNLLLCYSNSGNDSPVYVVDVSNPADMVKTFEFGAGKNFLHIQIYGRYVYGFFGLAAAARIVVYEFLGSSAIELSTKVYDTSINGKIIGSEIIGKNMFCFNNTDAKYALVDLTDPAVITTQNITWGTTEQAKSVALQENIIYAGCNGECARIDVTNPLVIPTIIKNTTPTSNMTGILAAGNYIISTEDKFSGGVRGDVYMFNALDMSLVQTFTPADDPAVAADRTKGLLFFGRYLVILRLLQAELILYDLNGVDSMQFLESSSIETGLMNIRSNLNVGGNINIGGGVSIGSGLSVNSTSVFTNDLSIVSGAVIHSGCIETDCVTVKSGSDLKLQNNAGTTSIQVKNNGDIEFTKTGNFIGLSAAGENNTSSNVGTAGVGIFKQKNGVDFEFKKINAGSNKITITDDAGNNEIDIDVAIANINIGDLNNAGTLVSVDSGISVGNVSLNASTMGNNLLVQSNGSGSLRTSNTLISSITTSGISNTSGNIECLTIQAPLGQAVRVQNNAGTGYLDVLNNNNALFSHDLTVSGDLIVNGTSVSINTTNVTIDDPIIKLADNNVSNTVNTGFYSQYNDGATKYRGLIHQPSQNYTYLFENTSVEPISNTNISLLDKGRLAVGAIQCNSVDAVSDQAYWRTASISEANRDALTAANGMIVFNADDNIQQFRRAGAWYDMPISRASYTTNILGSLEVKEDLVYQKPLFEAYGDAMANITACAVAGTSYIVNFGTNIVDNLSVEHTISAAGRITNNATVEKYYTTGLTMSFEDDKNANVEFYIYKNGVKLAGSTVNLSAAGGLTSTAIHKIVPMISGDYLELYCQSNTANTDITVSHVNIFGMSVPNTV
jgi:hypothetical protein